MTVNVKTSARYLIMAGGTGGHIFPAMAVAKSLQERGAEVHWLGTVEGMEYHLVPKEKITLHTISIKGFRGKNLRQKLLAPLQLITAIIQAVKILVTLRPQVVVGFGGYVAAPGGIAARLLGKSLIIHEQNSVAGSTNKLLAKISSQALEAFPGSLPNAKLVGNPVRAEVAKLFDLEKKVTSKQRINLLITGGSLGAEAINQLLPEVIKCLPESKRPAIWHQTGKNKLTKVLKDYQDSNIEVCLEEFIDQVEEAYQWADMIICRSGALTISEVAVVGVPAIFIPYPYAIDDHQSTNALWLVENKAALKIEQMDLSIQALTETLLDLLTHTEKLNAMSEKLKQLAIPDATQKVVAICEQACGRKNRHVA